MLRQLVYEDAIVRDLREGEWSKFIKERKNYYYRRAGELVRKLDNKGRLRKFRQIGTHTPTSDQAWDEEAFGGHKIEPLDGIICASSTSLAIKDQSIIVDISKLSRSNLWKEKRQKSIRLDRQIGSYKSHLETILKNSKSVMFIDPYLDPSEINYSDC